MDDAGGPLRSESRPAAGYPPSRSYRSTQWSSFPVLGVLSLLLTSPVRLLPLDRSNSFAASTGIIIEENSGEHEERAAAPTPTTVAGNPFPLASAAPLLS
ncbi:hypothetical protein KSP40_PGU020957 [Platanthera guangdongensis]|uniref:Uncharacterized protein n=1 Tax=Platanthera guangdongensis TaxID=2320717 RepID=A0ABR2MHP3_9ASPA